MPPMPPVCPVAQRAAAWGNLQSPLWPALGPNLCWVLKWCRQLRVGACAWALSSRWRSRQVWCGRPWLWAAASTCGWCTSRRAARRPSCLCWSTPRRCWAAPTSWSASRRTAVTGLCYCAPSCSWASRHCHPDTLWPRLPATTSTWCIISTNTARPRNTLGPPAEHPPAALCTLDYTNNPILPPSLAWPDLT